MEKKFLIPTIIGTILAAILIFTVVYKKTSNEPTKTVEIETVAPKETKPIESKVSTQQGTSSLEDFNVNTKGLREAGEGKEIPNLIPPVDEEEIQQIVESMQSESTDNSEENQDNTEINGNESDSGEDIEVDVSALVDENGRLNMDIINAIGALHSSDESEN